jgi:arylamine N-acetyltransferase
MPVFKTSASTWLPQFLETFSIGTDQHCSQSQSQTVLEQIIAAFSKFPYENLTKILTEGPRPPEQVWADFKAFGTGGTCFSLSFFLHHLLKNMGFESFLVTGDRSYGEDTHCGLIIRFRGDDFYIDPGFQINHLVPVPQDSPITIKRKFNTLLLEPTNNGKSFAVYVLHQKRKKLSYTMHTQPLSEDEFIDRWQRSFEFEMMNQMVVTRVENGTLHYFRDQWHHHFESEITRNRTEMNELSWVAEFSERTGIHADVVAKVAAKLK